MTRYQTLADALLSAPADRPFVTAWIDEDEQETVTFGEFRARAGRRASLLATHGVSAADRVVIIMPQSINEMAAFAGAMLLGAVPAILAYPNFKVEPAKYRSGLSGVTANLNAKVVFIDQDFPDDLLGHVALGDATLLRDADESNIQEQDPGQRRVATTPDSIAFIQHSAGTTGLQKGVALTHAAVLRHLEHLSSALQIDPNSDKVYSWLPLYHDMGLIACFMLPIVAHMPIIMQSPLDWVMHPDAMLEIFTEHRCTLAWLPNFAFQFVARRTPRDRWSKYDLSSARALINCSEPVRAKSMLEFQAAFGPCGLKQSALQTSYAMAENVFTVSQSQINKSGPRVIWADGQRFRSEHFIAPVRENEPGAVSFTSSGLLLPETEVVIISDSGETLADGYVGEIVIRSTSLFSGYYNRPDLTEKALRGGWYYSGDLGFMLDDELFVVGRKKDLLIVGGENIYPQDIEEIACNHPAIHDGRAIAMGIFNSDLGTEDIVVVAEVETEELLQNTDQIEQEIREAVVANAGFALRRLFLKPPKWIVKSTAGKPARSGTREKLLTEHPELGLDT